MLVVPLIERKRDGGALTPEEWSALVAAYTADRIPDYQMSALLMAVLLRGLERQELAALTDAVLASGQRLAFDSWGAPRGGKHSTGGGGGKGGLGVPPPVAAGGGGLPVKRGTGAFLAKVEQSLELAQTMIALGEDRGCPTVALLTAMDRPLGRACGNALETEEAILALRGEGPADLMEVTYALGVEMLLAAGLEKSTKQARNKLEGVLGAGLAAEKFEQVIEAQGGNPRAVEDPSVLPQAQAVEVFAARETGVVTRVEPRTIGRAIVAMGGGRRQVDDVIDPSVGFVITVKPGDKVLAGEPIASVFAKDAAGVKLGFEGLERAIEMGDRLADKPLPLVSHRVTKDGIEELTAGRKPVKGRGRGEGER